MHEGDNLCRLPFANEERNTALVYFKVTKIEIDTSNLPPLPLNLSLTLEERLKRGDFGALIDTSLTKVVQSGTEPGYLIPGQEILRYYSIGECYFVSIVRLLIEALV